MAVATRCCWSTWAGPPPDREKRVERMRWKPSVGAAVAALAWAGPLTAPAGGCESACVRGLPGGAPTMPVRLMDGVWRSNDGVSAPAAPPPCLGEATCAPLPREASGEWPP